jgi:hypothetical protein
MPLSKLKEEALDRTLWKTRFERAYRHVANRPQNEGGVLIKIQYQPSSQPDTFKMQDFVLNITDFSWIFLENTRYKNSPPTPDAAPPSLTVNRNSLF